MANVVKDFVTVLSEAKRVVDQGPMMHLNGHTSFHKWPVPEISDSQVATIKCVDAHRLFPKDIEAMTVEDEGSDNDLPQKADDQALEREDMVVPFPHEKHHLFGMELIHTFNPDVVMIFTVASGEMVKAVILKHKYGVCFVPTVKAKDFVHARLMEWLKQNNVLPPRPKIPKPDELLMWEKDHTGKPNDPSQTIAPVPANVSKTLPADPPIVPQTLPADPSIVSKTLPAVPPATLPTPATTADPAQKAGVPIVKVPSMVVPKIASFGSSIL